MKIKIKRDAGAILPDYSHDGDAGLDIYSNQEVIIKPGEIKSVDTGLYFEIPKGYVGLVWDKGGIAFNHGIKTMAGVVDAGYRGELKIVLANHSKKDFEVKNSMKIAQLLIQEIEKAEVEEVQELTDTSRGEGRFSSTGLFKK
jgi:dUTP pyrophosphatase